MIPQSEAEYIQVQEDKFKTCLKVYLSNNFSAMIYKSYFLKFTP